MNLKSWKPISSQFIGSGTDADVFLYSKMNCIGMREFYAVKMYKKQVNNLTIRQDYLSLKKVRSNKCVQVHTVDKVSGRISILMEFIDGVTLQQLSTQSKLTDSELKNIAGQCLQALLDLKKYGLCHGDLSFKNILIDNKGEVKLVDFGLGNLKEQKITAHWVDSESLVRNQRDFKADLYSLGLILECICQANQLNFDLYGSLIQPRKQRSYKNFHPTDHCLASVAAKVQATQKMMNERTHKMHLSKRPMQRKIKKPIKWILNIYLFLGLSFLSQAERLPEYAYLSIVPEKWVSDVSIAGKKISIPIGHLKIPAGKNTLIWYVNGRKIMKTLTIKQGEHKVLDDKFFER